MRGANGDDDGPPTRDAPFDFDADLGSPIILFPDHDDEAGACCVLDFDEDIGCPMIPFPDRDDEEGACRVLEGAGTDTTPLVYFDIDQKAT